MDIKQEMESQDSTSSLNRHDHNAHKLLQPTTMKSEASLESEDDNDSAQVTKILVMRGKQEEIYKMESSLIAAEFDTKAGMEGDREPTGMDVMNMLLDSWVS